MKSSRVQLRRYLCGCGHVDTGHSPIVKDADLQRPSLFFHRFPKRFGHSRSKALSNARIPGRYFTISNPGMMGIKDLAINPQAAIRCREVVRWYMNESEGEDGTYRRSRVHTGTSATLSLCHQFTRVREEDHGSEFVSMSGEEFGEILALCAAMRANYRRSRTHWHLLERWTSDMVMSVARDTKPADCTARR